MAILDRRIDAHDEAIAPWNIDDGGVVSDADVADIHAWLASQPKPADPNSIPLLKQ